MNKKSGRKKRKVFLLIIVTAITAIVLIVETYAWFVGLSTVNTNSFNINVSSDSGLELSLNGQYWVSGDSKLTISSSTIASHTTCSNASCGYNGNTNSWPAGGLRPLSSPGRLDTTTGRLIFFEKSSLSATPGGYRIVASQVDNSSQEVDGYVAFDLFIRNGTGTSYTNSYASGTAENVYLKKNPTATIDGGTGNHGAANSLRIGFFEIAGMKANGASVSDIQGLSCSTTGTNKIKICASGGQYLNVNWNVWEPNHNNHTSEVVSYFNSMCKRRNNSGAYSSTPCDSINTTSVVSTYLINRNISSSDNVDIYDVLNTYYGNLTVSDAALTAENSYKSPTGDYTDSNQLLLLAGNSVTKVRVYIWLEGQDIDNYDLITKNTNVKISFGLTKNRYEIG